MCVYTSELVAGIETGMHYIIYSIDPWHSYISLIVCYSLYIIDMMSLASQHPKYIIKFCIHSQ